MVPLEYYLCRCSPVVPLPRDVLLPFTAGYVVRGPDLGKSLQQVYWS